MRWDLNYLFFIPYYSFEVYICIGLILLWKKEDKWNKELESLHYTEVDGDSYVNFDVFV